MGNVTYERVVLCCMSGTGNTWRIAEWLAEQVRAAGGSVTLRPVDAGTPDLALMAPGPMLLGLLMPTHGFTAPWAMIRLVLGLPRGGGRHAFVICTRGGTKVGSMCLPGLEGTACYLIVLLLLLKGYSVRGSTGIDMPVNWIAVHPGLKPENAAVITGRAKERVRLFFEGVLGGRRVFRGAISLAFGLLLLPVSLGYLLYGRFMLGKWFFTDAHCTGCGLCAQNCPHGALQLRGKGQPRPYWSLACESCMRCMALCPERAIQAGHSWAVLLALISSVPTGVPFAHWLMSSLPWLADLKSGWVMRLVQYPFYLAAIIAAYQVFWWLLRLPPVNALFAWTTFTRVFRRYHEADTDLRRLKANRD